MNPLTEAPKLAQAMLMRQQAMAPIDARQPIVEGVVEIVRDAIERWKRAMLEVDEFERDELAANPLVFLFSRKRAQPVLRVGTGHQLRGRT